MYIQKIAHHAPNYEAMYWGIFTKRMSWFHSRYTFLYPSLTFLPRRYEILISGKPSFVSGIAYQSMDLDWNESLNINCLSTNLRRLFEFGCLLHLNNPYARDEKSYYSDLFKGLDVSSLLLLFFLLLTPL